MKKNSRKTILLIEDHPDYIGSIIFDAKLLETTNQNLYIIYFLNSNQSIQ